MARFFFVMTCLTTSNDPGKIATCLIATGPKTRPKEYNMSCQPFEMGSLVPVATRMKTYEPTAEQSAVGFFRAPRKRRSDGADKRCRVHWINGLFGKKAAPAVFPRRLGPRRCATPDTVNGLKERSHDPETISSEGRLRSVEPAQSGTTENPLGRDI